VLKVGDGCKLTFNILNPLSINIGLNGVTIAHGPSSDTFLIDKSLRSFEEILTGWDKTKATLRLDTKLVLRPAKITKLEVTLKNLSSLPEYYVT
jgi:hypothetical protein